jgi:O-antigen ligase
MAIAFFLPVFGRIVPLFIILMALNWIVSGDIMRLFGKAVLKPGRLVVLSFAGLYLLYLLGLSYTSNFDYAWFDLEVKLSLLIFPLIFATATVPMFTVNQYNKILVAFVAGCISGSLILLVHAGISQYLTHIDGSFYYTRLAWYAHSTYMAMYYNLAIAVVLILLMEKRSLPSARTAFAAMLTFFLSWMILLLSSKAGLLALAMVLVSLSALAWFEYRSKIMSYLILGTGILVFSTGWIALPQTFGRFSAAGKALTVQADSVRIKPESNADRIAVWSVAIGIIKENPWIGVGTGDVKDALIKGYASQGAIPAMEHKYNAHSQFIQTFITLGLPGFLFYLLMLAIPAVWSFMKRRWIYLLFLMVFAINSLTESMMEVQAGVVFYAFFNILLFTSGKKEGPGSPEPC